MPHIMHSRQQCALGGQIPASIVCPSERTISTENLLPHHAQTVVPNAMWVLF